MDRAAPGDPTQAEGWLNRTLQLVGSSSSIAGITLGTAKSKSLIGAAPSLALPSIDAFAITGRFAAERRAALEALYATSSGALASGSGELFGALDTIGGVDTTTGVPYPTGDLGAALAGVAPELGAALAAFHEDLGADAARTVTIVMTEFGRTAAQNGSLGTDHGHGSVMMALGGPVAGGQVLTNGDWPGLGAADLFEGRDLAVTTDFRDLFAEVLDRHMGVGDPSAIFPDFTPDESRYPGVLPA